MPVRNLSRRITMSADYVSEKKLTPSALVADGWTLRDKTWVKNITIPQYVEAGKNPAPENVPDIGDPSFDDVGQAVQDFMTDYSIPASTLLAMINNGIYLYYNAKAKPRANRTQADLRSLFINKVSQTDPLFQQFIVAMSTKSDDDFLKNWFKTLPVAAE